METPPKERQTKGKKTKMPYLSARHKDQFVLTPPLLILTLTANAQLKLVASIALSDVSHFFLFSTHCFTFFKILKQKGGITRGIHSVWPRQLGFHSIVDIVAKCSENTSRDDRMPNTCTPSQITQCFAAAMKALDLIWL